MIDAKRHLHKGIVHTNLRLRKSNSHVDAAPEHVRDATLCKVRSLKEIVQKVNNLTDANSTTN